MVFKALHWRDNMVGAYVVAVTSMAVTTNKPFLITKGDSSNKNKSKVCQKWPAQTTKNVQMG